MTYLLQEVSRRKQITIESLAISYRLMAQKERMYSLIKAEASNSFYIEGLFIHGAKWNEKEKTIIDVGKY